MMRLFGFTCLLLLASSMPAFATKPRPPTKDMACITVCQGEARACLNECPMPTTDTKPPEGDIPDDDEKAKKKQKSKSGGKAQQMSKPDACATECAKKTAPCFKECK